MLSGKRLVMLAKQAHEEHPEAYEALLEYERTGKLPKPNPKIRANFTLDAKLFRQFRVYCKQQGFSMSALIEKFLAESMERKIRNGRIKIRGKHG